MDFEQVQIFIIRFSPDGTVGIGTVGIFLNARGTVGFFGIPTVPMSVNKTMPVTQVVSQHL